MLFSCLLKLSFQFHMAFWQKNPQVSGEDELGPGSTHVVQPGWRQRQGRSEGDSLSPRFVQKAGSEAGLVAGLYAMAKLRQGLKAQGCAEGGLLGSGHRPQGREGVLRAMTTPSVRSSFEKSYKHPTVLPLINGTCNEAGTTKSYHLNTPSFCTPNITWWEAHIYF